ncbi:MAG: alpha/beta hydrolase-fold protein [Gemmatimonadaceae bacterium]
MIGRVVGAFAIVASTLCAFPRVAESQQRVPPGPTLKRLLEIAQPNDSLSIKTFWDSVGKRGTPFVDSVHGDSAHIVASFVYRSATINNVILENGVMGWNYILNQLERVPGTDIWHISALLPADIRLGYVFRENDDLIPWGVEPNQGVRWKGNRPDPFNPRMDSAQGKRSLIVGPRAAPDHWSVPNEHVAAGKIEDVEFESAVHREKRKVSVYLPPVPSTKGLPLLVVFDGPTYRHVVRLPVIVDNLLAERKIAPVVILFVEQVDRMQELAPNETFTTYVTRELIPWMRQRYQLSGDPRHTIVAGSSHGGLAAVSLAVQHPEEIGNVIAQSPSLWWSPPQDSEPEWLARVVAHKSKMPVRFYLEVGTLEIDRSNGGKPGQLDVSRHFRDVLNARGYDVTYSEFTGGHEYQSWRVTIPNALMKLLGH